MSDDGRACCILQICCEGGSAAQHEALVHLILHQRPNITEEKAQKAADRVLRRYQNFDEIRALIDSDE